ncbi:Uncharacterized protein BM_BM12683 [Brugia malayi]|uniref:Bm12683 n=2 Tax=Brugia TaxID=6278 RepID=A0A0K0IVF8_BRUMA|nr:Uncharacterized protein BM_BM12683 [Brugia malayi]CDQ08342.1 Bm12683 [Brugia malayi]VDO11154.1 unnamed protein product [Brugia timori]VIO88861.1 Uncharacterized protein BM_BM12683 [Brugia malayi]
MSNFEEGPPIASHTKTKSTVDRSAGLSNDRGTKRTTMTGNQERMKATSTKKERAKL